MATITNQLRSTNWRGIWHRIAPALFSLILALLIGALLLLASGRNPLDAYASLISGAFGTWPRFTETLVRATPFLILAISVSISFRCGVWNIGAEGQLILGAIASTWAALTFNSLPPFVLLPLTLLAGIIGGALWSGIAGVLKAYFNANEVITTSMLNFIAVYLLAFLVNGPMMDPQGFNFPQSPLINESLELPRLLQGGRLEHRLCRRPASRSLARSSSGAARSAFEQKSWAPAAVWPAHVGLNVTRTIVMVTVISGAVAGIAGWGEIFGIHFRLIDAIAVGMGSLAVVVALLGELHPLGMAVAAILFGALVVGGSAMERNAGVPFALVDVIQGVIILLVLARSFIFRGRSA